MELLSQYLQIKNQIKALEVHEKALKAQIKEQFGIGKHETDGYKVNRSNRIRIDLDKQLVLEKLGKELYQQCEKATEYEVLLVTATK